jgi:hypothetical protein
MTEFSREVCPRFITLYNLNINLYKIVQTWDTKGKMSNQPESPIWVKEWPSMTASSRFFILVLQNENS